MNHAVSVSGAHPRPIVLDVDPGIDDALAILLALRSPELKVEAISVVAGNVEVAQGVENALKILELAGRTDIPVARGAEKPLLGNLTTSKKAHGENGLGNLELPRPRLQPFPGSAVDLIAARVEGHAGGVTVLPVGPLTNIASFLKLRPDLVPRIKEIVLMGGSASGGNITPAAEFNIFNDPEAAQIVFQSGVPIVMVGLDVTRKTVLRSGDLAGVDPNVDPVGRLVLGLIDFAVRARGSEGLVLHDPLAVGVAIDPTFVEAELTHVEVETRGEKTRGETVVNGRRFRLPPDEGRGKRTAAERELLPPNARVCFGVDAERFVRFYVERVLRV